MQTLFLKSIALAALVGLAGCSNAIPHHGLWNGVVQLPEGIEVTFRMDLDLSQAKPVGHFLVGEEKTPIPEIAVDGNKLHFDFSEYGAEVRAAWDGQKLSGTYSRLRASGTRSFIFSATPEASSSRESGPASPLPLGVFEVSFEDQKPEDGITMARVWQDGTSYFGTFIAPDGDYGLLQATTTKLQFDRFTGWQAIAIELRPGSGDATPWSGRFHAASNEKPRAFTLRPRSNLEVPAPPSKQTAMKDPDAAFAFACSSLTGETVRNTDERFKGKALAIDIMGTWCHNCMDESPVLQDLYRQYSKDGFEVVGLSFEVKDDADLGRKNLTLFRDRFALTYPLLYCGSVDDSNLDKQLKNQLQNFFAFPTTLFIAKTGKVKAVHSGFRGPGTGDEFDRQVQKLHELVKLTL
jgi:thiol-disulfide isomerase/thioredoxin